MSQLKCGDVFRDADGNFNYTCQCCEFEFMSANDFEEHVNAHFPQFLEVVAESEPKLCILQSTIKTEDVTKFSIAIENEPDEDYNDADVGIDDDDIEDISLEGFDFMEREEDILVPTIGDILEEIGKERRPFTCDCCNEYYDCAGLKQQHLHPFVDLAKSCAECPAFYEKENELNAHKKLHNLANTMVCPFCSEIFSSVNKIKRHLNCTAAINNGNNLKASPKTKKRKLSDRSATVDGASMEKGSKRDKYTCDICKKEYAYLHYLKEHLKRHSDNTLLHTCEVCGHEFKLRQNLTAHMRTHTGEKPYQCKLCGKAFNQPYYMTIHMRIHSKDKPYKCDLCGVSFVTSSHLGRHMKSHNNIKPHKCTICDRAFILPGHLRDHMRSQHTGERPFSCEICGNNFARRKLLRQHMQLHGEKRFKCKFCDLAFAQSAGRRGHEIRVHNVKCETLT